MEAPRTSILGGYRSGLRGVVGASATAYTYYQGRSRQP